MNIPVTSTCKLTPHQFAEEMALDIRAIDSGLDFILAQEDRAVGFARFALTRQGQNRGWRIVVFNDGTSFVSHPKCTPIHYTDVRSLHEAVKDLVVNGHD